MNTVYPGGAVIVNQEGIVKEEKAMKHPFLSGMLLLRIPKDETFLHKAYFPFLTTIVPPKLF